MTMKPIVEPLVMPATAFDQDAQYRYTWPGQNPKVVSGKELQALCRGADPSMLAIEKIGTPPEPPETADLPEDITLDNDDE